MARLARGMQYRKICRLRKRALALRRVQENLLSQRKGRQVKSASLVQQKRRNNLQLLRVNFYKKKPD